MPDSESRRYERIAIELPCRLYVTDVGGALRFQAFCKSRNLGLGGVFVGSTFLLKEGLPLNIEITLPDGPLTIRAKVAHVVGEEDTQLETGMGIEFLDVDSHGRETLLRYFTPVRYHTFYDSFVREFPHLKKTVPLNNVSLVLNLWEEWKIRAQGGPLLTSSGAPPSLPVRPGPGNSAGPARKSGRGRK